MAASPRLPACVSICTSPVAGAVKVNQTSVVGAVLQVGAGVVPDAVAWRQMLARLAERFSLAMARQQRAEADRLRRLQRKFRRIAGIIR